MKVDIQCVSPHSSIQTAAHQMRDQNVGFLPVCDKEMRVVGTLTDRDIAIRAVADNLPASTLVEALMSREVVGCSPQDDLNKARDLMGQHHKSRIMCIGHGGKLEGVISLSDLAQLDELTGVDTLRRVSSREARRQSIYIS